MSVYPMRRFLVDATGVLAVAVTVGLAWPGVQTARADDAALMSVDPALEQAQAARPDTAPQGAAVREAPSCNNPGVPSMLDDALVAHQIRRAMQAYAQRIQAESPQDPDQGIVLNGTGYNYKPMRVETP